MPYKLPTDLHPAGSVCITLAIPDDPGYIDAFVGAMLLLAQWRNWQRDPTRAGTVAATVMRNVFATMRWESCPPPPVPPPLFPPVFLEDCDMHLRQDPVNPCLLELECVDGSWVVWADLSKCMPNPAPGNNPPKVPPGGSGGVCFEAAADQLTPLPFLVTTGDTLDFTTIEGAGTDGATATWYCVDGSIYFLGVCAGGGSTQTGDPLNTTKHMALLLKIGTTFYPLMPGVFTVPSGVSAVQPYIQVNSSAVASARGKYNICVTYTNNAAQPPGVDHYDFSLVDGGFVDARWQYNRPESVWQPGLGWGNTDQNSIVSPGKQLLASGHITRIVVHYLTTTHTETGGGVVIGNAFNNNAVGGWGPPTTSDNIHYVMDSGTISVNVTAANFLTIQWQNNNVNSPNSQVVTSIDIYRSSATPLI